MCLQCTTNAIAVFPDVLPGFSLYQAQTGAPEWAEGWFGLVECNDPTVVFPGPLLTDPLAGLSDEQVNALDDMPPEYQRFTDAADALAEHLVLPATDGYRLTAACIAQGYDHKRDGHLHYWLLHYLASKVAQMPQVSAS